MRIVNTYTLLLSLSSQQAKRESDQSFYSKKRLRQDCIVAHPCHIVVMGGNRNKTTGAGFWNIEGLSYVFKTGTFGRSVTPPTFLFRHLLTSAFLA